MRHIDPSELSADQAYQLLTMLVVPRPIAWISTVSLDGTPNLAPHSYFNIVSNEPPVVHFTSAGHKDTLRNVLDTGEFVVNVVSRDLLQQMNVTAVGMPATEDEFGWAGLERTESTRVKPHRVAAARAAMECTLRDVIEIGNGRMAFGDVIAFHTADDLWVGDDIPAERLDPVGRLGGTAYQTLDGVEHLDRPNWDTLRASR